MSVDQKAIHTCDTPARIRQCLDCTQTVCSGECPALRAIPAARYNRKQAPVQPDESVHAVVRWIRAGATERFIMRELGLDKRGLTRKIKVAVRARLLLP